MNVSIKPPEIKMTLGETVECTDGDTWLFVGYVQTTISYQLAFLNVSKLSLASPRFYHATHKHTIQKKFPELRKRDPEWIKRDDEEECPECGIATLRGKGLNEGGGVECRNPDCSYWFCY